MSYGRPLVSISIFVEPWILPWFTIGYLDETAEFDVALSSYVES